MTHFTGRARRLGDDVNTDYIISSKRKKETLDEQMLKRYLLESVDPGFAASVHNGDIIVAGANFGCGSAMEVAVTVIQAAGIRAVIAKTFARSFYRNAINNGLLPIECDTSRIQEGDAIAARLVGDRVEVRSLTQGNTVFGTALPPIGLAILECGGLVDAVRRFGSIRRLDAASHGA